MQRLPGPLYANQAYSNVERNYQIVTGFDWNICRLW